MNTIAKEEKEVAFSHLAVSPPVSPIGLGRAFIATDSTELPNLLAVTDSLNLRQGPH